MRLFIFRKIDYKGSKLKRNEMNVLFRSRLIWFITLICGYESIVLRFHKLSRRVIYLSSIFTEIFFTYFPGYSFTFGRALS